MASVRVLLFTPAVNIAPETLASIFALTYPGPLDRLITRDNPISDEPSMNIIYNYKKAQRAFFDGLYDVLFTVEHDIILPPDALDKLLAAGGDIAYGVYPLRHGGDVLNIMHAQDGNSYSVHRKEWRALAGGVVECRGVGYGCTVIRRQVLEACELRTVNGGGDSDSVLAAEAREKGFVQVADTSVLCGHKRPDTVILLPQPDGTVRRTGVSNPITRQVHALIPFSHWPNDTLTITRPADPPVAIDFEMARKLVKAGMAEYAEGPA